MCDSRLQEGGVIEADVAGGRGLKDGASHEDAALDPPCLQHLVHPLQVQVLLRHKSHTTKTSNHKDRAGGRENTSHPTNPLQSPPPCLCCARCVGVTCFCSWSMERATVETKYLTLWAVTSLALASRALGSGSLLMSSHAQYWPCDSAASSSPRS